MPPTFFIDARQHKLIDVRKQRGRFQSNRIFALCEPDHSLMKPSLSSRLPIASHSASDRTDHMAIHAQAKWASLGGRQTQLDVIVPWHFRHHIEFDVPRTSTRNHADSLTVTCIKAIDITALILFSFNLGVAVNDSESRVLNRCIPVQLYRCIEAIVVRRRKQAFRQSMSRKVLRPVDNALIQFFESISLFGLVTFDLVDRRLSRGID